MTYGETKNQRRDRRRREREEVSEREYIRAEALWNNATWSEKYDIDFRRAFVELAEMVEDIHDHIDT